MNQFLRFNKLVSLPESGLKTVEVDSAGLGHCIAASLRRLTLPLDLIDSRLLTLIYKGLHKSSGDVVNFKSNEARSGKLEAYYRLMAKGIGVVLN